MTIMFTAIILLIGTSDSLVVWDYPMCSLPPGWTSYNWGFNSIWGAYLIIASSSPYSQSDGEMVSGVDTVFVPDDCIYIAFHADQELYLNTSGTGCSYVIVYCSYGSNWTILWSKSNNYSSQSPLDISIPVTQGGTLFMRFFGYTSAGADGSGSVAWTLSDLTLTLYIVEINIAPSSWASIKSAY